MNRGFIYDIGKKEKESWEDEAKRRLGENFDGRAMNESTLVVGHMLYFYLQIVHQYISHEEFISITKQFKKVMNELENLA
jgi:hypothetical protein